LLNKNQLTWKINNLYPNK